MVYRLYNFNPGPATLPLPVLQETQEQLLNYQGTGMSVMEISHRSREFEEIIYSAEALLRAMRAFPQHTRYFFYRGAPVCNLPWYPLIFYLPETRLTIF